MPEHTSILMPEHRSEWEASAVLSDIIDRNVWSIDDPSDVDKLLNRNTDKRWKHSTDLAPGWAVAGVAPTTGERTFAGAQYKPDNPPLDPETKKPRKYFSPSRQALAPLFLEMEDRDYWPKLITDTSQAICICEGAKKAGALLTEGHPAISIPGVSTGGKLGRLRPELELFCAYGRVFYLFFDRDIIEKRQVRRALHNLGRMLAAKGAMVYVVEWDNKLKGIDDAIAAGVEVTERITAAPTLEEWKADTDENDTEAPEGEPCALARRYQMVSDRLKNRLRWNELKSQVELDGEPCDFDSLRLQLALLYNIQLPDADCTAICSHIARQQNFSPVAEYLNQCAKLYPADSELLDSLGPTFLGTTSELHQVYLRKTLISAVARAFWPGCKVDTVCILSGGQGVGKSSFWKILAGEEWFDDTVGSTSDKDERLKLHQSWFIEWAELEAVFKRKDISAVKAFITTQTDQVRPPYGRTVQEFKRPSIIVGSTNETEFLADATGNRRYWVIPVEIPMVPFQQLSVERDRIWGAVVHAFRSGERWELPHEMHQAAQEDALNYVTSDPWEKKILDYCEDFSEVNTADVLAVGLQLPYDRQGKREEMRVSNLLRINGWRSVRRLVNGRRPRYWINPKFGEKVGSGWSEEVQTHVNGGDQPNDQPNDQPPDQPTQNDNLETVDHRTSSKVTNLTNLTNQIPKRGNIQDESLCPDREVSIVLPPVGAKVEIKKGRYDGVAAWVVAHVDEKVAVKRDGWMITREYLPGEVEVLSDANG
ncbi:VapE domain-containing protein [Nodosilinea sp. E11]|uniref:VapE domain-containing protein n=1 Tax=Nodosilinea sp. E11 TaxID=3037479 RepID=UPI002934741B|nr:VapE domain-containing protein [Nodosilinea sp. E11]WOD37386.1 VapE family protein [Nodosilinea sp. E11]WOD37948.1 VapE family protein [Nodosilinea sp. E11]